MPPLPRRTRNRSGDPSLLPASNAIAAVDAPSLARLLDILDRLRILLERVLVPTPAGILADYLTPAEVATEFGFRENQLSEWKRNRFGPPRTRLKRRVMYGREAVRDWLRSLEENSDADGGAAGDRERSQR